LIAQVDAVGDRSGGVEADDGSGREIEGVEPGDQVRRRALDGPVLSDAEVAGGAEADRNPPGSAL